MTIAELQRRIARAGCVLRISCSLGDWRVEVTRYLRMTVHISRVSLEDALMRALDHAEATP